MHYMLDGDLDLDRHGEAPGSHRGVPPDVFPDARRLASHERPLLVIVVTAFPADPFRRRGVDYPVSK
jgi:hypothetical protein